MGRSKRKNISPLQKDCGKSRRTVEDATGSDVEEDGGSQVDQGDVIADLKEFIRNENSRSNRTLAEEIRRFNDERMTALENSLSFALTTNETLAKRLVAVEEKAKQTEKDFRMCVERLAELEGELDQMQQRELKDWLVFSGPAVPRLTRAGGGRSEDASRLLHAMRSDVAHGTSTWSLQQLAELRPRAASVSSRVRLLESQHSGSPRRPSHPATWTRVSGVGRAGARHLTATRRGLP